MSSRAFFSVILPVFNRAHCLERALDSVLKQSFQDWECHVCDDASTDSSLDLIEQYAKKYPEKFFLHSFDLNQGVSAARNKAIQKSRAPYLAFLDSDDEWLEEKLEKQYKHIQSFPQGRIFHCDENWYRKGRFVNPMKKHMKKGGDLFESSLQLCSVSPSCAVIKRSLFDEKGPFREDFPVCEDYDLWLKISSSFEFSFLDEKLVNRFGGHEDQLSSRYHSMDYWRVRALLDLRSKALLSVEQKLLLDRELQKKLRVLIRGSQKNNRFDWAQSFKKVEQDLVSQVPKITELPELALNQLVRDSDEG